MKLLTKSRFRKTKFGKIGPVSEISANRAVFTVLKIQDVDLKIQIRLTNLIAYFKELSFALSGIENGSFSAEIAC